MRAVGGESVAGACPALTWQRAGVERRASHPLDALPHTRHEAAASTCRAQQRGSVEKCGVHLHDALADNRNEVAASIYCVKRGVGRDVGNCELISRLLVL